jgi:predicted NBD/HSP70 family sugar kinase
MELSDVRRHHLSVVLEHLVRNGARSRAAIAQDTGLTKATVSSLVADLLDRDLVEELDTPSAGRIGRPATDVAAAGHRVGALGLQIDVDEVAACVVDLTGEIRVVHRQVAGNRDVPASKVIARLRQVTARALTDAAALGIHCIGGTLALPGLVDPRSGTLFVAPNLHWFDADLNGLAGKLKLPAGFPIAVDNEANLAALAELRHGAGQHLSSFVHVSAGGGVGAGIVIDGRVLRGSHGFAGELGHVVVDPTGKPCACGARGCLETLLGSDAATPPTADDAVADALAAALRTVVHLVDPEAVVLGGTLAGLGDSFATRVAARLHDITLGARWHPCVVHRSLLGADAALVGAATAALDTLISDPTTVPLRASAQPA